VLFLTVLAVCPAIAWGDENESDYTPVETAAVDECMITNVFYDTDLREVLNSMAAQCGVTIVADESVMGIVTIELMDVPLKDAMKRVLTPYGMAYRWLGDYYLVGAARPDNPSFPLLAETELYRPSFVKAGDIPLLLSTYYEGFIRVNENTNTVTLYGPPDVLERLKADLAKIDVAPRQVMIEVLVAEISDENLRELGIDAYLSAEKDGRIAKATIPLARIPAQDIPLSNNGGTTEEVTNLLDSAIHVFGGRMGDVWNGWNVDYEIALRALYMDGKVDYRANPKLATAEGQTARIYVGQDEYHTIISGRVGNEYVRLEVIKVGTVLEITPYVAEDGRITIEALTTVSDVTGMGVTGLPVVSTRDVSTKITVQDGEPIVIGGLKTELERIRIRKIPLLGDIPILGALFRNTSRSKSTTNIVIVITPHLIKDGVSGIAELP
jgi:type IV pilus assembly protein PilQ